MSNIKVGGPASELEAEAQKKLITEKEIKAVLNMTLFCRKDIQKTKVKLQELLAFYDRIIRSIDITVRTVKSKNQLSYQQKQNLYLINQEKELSQAKAEKSKFRRYLKKINLKLLNNDEQHIYKGEINEICI